MLIRWLVTDLMCRRNPLILDDADASVNQLGALPFLTGRSACDRTAQGGACAQQVASHRNDHGLGASNRRKGSTGAAEWHRRRQGGPWKGLRRGLVRVAPNSSIGLSN